MCNIGFPDDLPSLMSLSSLSSFSSFDISFNASQMDVGAISREDGGKEAVTNEDVKPKLAILRARIAELQL